MDLDFNIKALDNKNLEMTLFVNKEKMNMLDFICYMQFEYFSSFLVSALIDVQTLHGERFKTVVFPVFRHGSFREPLVLGLSYQESTGGFGNGRISEDARSRYYRVMKEGNNLVFIPSRKETVHLLSELLVPENKVFLQKMMKGLFEKVFLMLSSNPAGACSIVCKNDIFFFILTYYRDGRTERIPEQQDILQDERQARPAVRQGARLRLRPEGSLHKIPIARNHGHQELFAPLKKG
jgi:hypothetical protein